MKLARETWVLVAIGMADLTSTILFIQKHGAQEANPIFRHYWEMGLFNFILAKMVLLIGPLLILEWARRRQPRLVARALQFAIVGYIGLYSFGVARLNSNAARNAELAYYEANGESYPPISRDEVQRMLKAFHQNGTLPHYTHFLSTEDSQQ